ncbi:MAG TPA: SGNH/GDSL hydrolase family protein [Candidatus Udaeobacter sp.]|nr:SGNH/GDSL hydrolase family protein [Candidatus Udaeobacter sp.]
MLGVLLALFAVELFLRVTGFGMVKPQLAFDPNTRAVLQAGDLVVDRNLFWRESDPGPDDPERDLRVIRVGDAPPPKSGKLRLLCLGDSCTRIALGGLPFSRLLEEQLGPDSVEVWNAGLPGYSSHQGLAWLRAQLLDYRPDLVIVYFGWNDHWRTTGFTDRELAARLVWWQPRLVNLFRRPHRPPPFRVPLPDFAANLRAIAELTAAQGGETLFITAPARVTREAEARHIEQGYILPGDNLPALHASYVAEVRRLSGVPKARICDVAAVFDRLAEPDLLMPDGIHPTDQGHHVLAALLADDVAVHDMAAPDVESNREALALAVLAQSYAAAGRWQEAIQRSERAAGAAPKDLDVVLGQAWLLAACPVDSLRQPARALAVLDGYAGVAARSYRFYDVRAAALAALGRYPQAVTAAEEALRVFDAAGDDPRLANGIRGRLERYRAGQAYVLPVPR